MEAHLVVEIGPQLTYLQVAIHQTHFQVDHQEAAEYQQKYKDLLKQVNSNFCMSILLKTNTGYETRVFIHQTWPEEPSGFDREALVKVPATPAGKKWPVIIDLHGAGGSANLRRLSDLSDAFVIVAASGYNRFWNVYSEKSKADDVDFILRLIKKVGEDIPEADIENVAIVGTSNGAAMIYRLLIETRNPRPFKTVIPLASSLINVQYHDGSFWTENKQTNQWDLEQNPDTPGPNLFHFHGSDDGTPVL